MFCGLAWDSVAIRQRILGDRVPGAEIGGLPPAVSGLGHLIVDVEGMAARFVPSADELIASSQAAEELRVEFEDAVERMTGGCHAWVVSRAEPVWWHSSTDWAIAGPEMGDVGCVGEDLLAGLESVVAEKARHER
ncbi:hypothetical protein AMK34_01740 [Amycolatopsis sp. CB00013]|nr:hypothetical protein AMK34_01740 [Amycolatopsis sp. CB00013]